MHRIQYATRNLIMMLILSLLAPTLTIATPSSFTALEKTAGERLGVVAIDTGKHQLITYRENERFPMGSTAKVMAVAAVLKKSMTDDGLLKKRIYFTKQAIEQSGYAPITKQHVSDGMTIAELCSAAISHSDNAAMNLLVTALSGLNVVNEFAHSIGDEAFRLDRHEPELNTATPGDFRDTTTPIAMGKSLEKILLDNVLATPQRELLQHWLINNVTGDKRIRAGAPKGVIVGDKTGTSAYGTTNDIGIIWPAQGSPIIIAIYFTQGKQDAPPRNVIISAATDTALKKLQQRNTLLSTAP